MNKLPFEITCLCRQMWTSTEKTIDDMQEFVLYVYDELEKSNMSDTFFDWVLNSAQTTSEDNDFSRYFTVVAFRMCEQNDWKKERPTKGVNI